MKTLTHLSLFTGIGGLDLAAEAAGFQTVGQCEWADYPTKVLEKHWPGVPRWRDIRTLTGDSFYERTGLRTVDVISGGFPCQPFSVAGKQKGKDDERYLWPEMLRVAREIRPNWIIGENVSGLVRKALDDILESLENESYTARAYAFKACEIGAPFAGERIAIVASTDDRSATLRWDSQFQPDARAQRRGNHNGGGAPQLDTGKWWSLESRPYGVANGVPERLHGGRLNEQTGSEKSGAESRENGEVRDVWGDGSEVKPAPQELRQLHRRDCIMHEMSCKDTREEKTNGDLFGMRERVLSEPFQKREQDMQFRVFEDLRADVCDEKVAWWSNEPNIPRVAKSVKNRVERLKCLGNAVVPAQFYPIFQAIADIENGIGGENDEM